MTDVSAAVYSSGIVVTGRVSDEEGGQLGATFRYDLGSDTWCTLEARLDKYIDSWGHGSAAIDKDLYLFGGVGGAGVSEVIQKLDIVAQGWEEVV